MSYGVGIHGLGDLLFGIPVLIYLHIDLQLIDAQSIALSCIYIATSTILCLAVYIIANSLVFWYDSGGRTSIPYMVTNVGQYARYPLKIYPVAIQFILCFIVPYAFMGLFPAMMVTRKISGIYLLAILSVTAFFLMIAIAVFKKGITKYESAGM